MATKRKPTPAQIAARERFAEMARSGAFKRKNNPMVISKQADESLSRKGSRGYVRQLLDRYSDDGHVVSVKKTRSGSIGIAFDGGRMLTVASARKKLEDHYGITERMKRRANPAKKTVSQKISQLTREGYPQKQAVAIALSEERAGKVRRNPIERYELRRLDKRNDLDSTYKTLTQAKSALDEIDRPAASFYVVDTETGKHYFSFQAETKLPHIEIRGTAMQKAYKRNPRASNPIILVSDKPITSKRKRNPQAPSIKHKGARNIAYAVEAKRMLAGGGAQFEMIAGFPTKAQAQDYIDALLKSYPKGLTLRISAA